MLTGGLAWNRLDEDHFVLFDLGTVLDFGTFRAGLHVPLNVRIKDNEPENEGRIRCKDWDEAGEWFRVIRFIEVGQPYVGEFYARYGELVAATLGHGTIVDGYYNTLDPDHYQGGLQMRLDRDRFGAELMVDNLVRPEVFGTRVFYRPFLNGAPFGPRIFRRFAVGFNLVMDIHAPDIVTRSGGGFPVYNDSGLPEASFIKTGIVGLDAELPLLKSKSLHSIFYSDFNLHAPDSFGAHLGFRNLWKPNNALQLTARIEYQFLGPGYLPSYVNALYELERYQYLDQKTKLGWTESVLADEQRHGVMIELGAQIFSGLVIRGRYQESGRPNDSTVWLQAMFPTVAGLTVSASYLKRTGSGFSDAFDPDEALLIAQARYQFWGPLALQCLFSREWRVVDDTSSTDVYQSVDTWQAGVVTEFRF